MRCLRLDKKLLSGVFELVMALISEGLTSKHKLKKRRLAAAEPESAGEFTADYVLWQFKEMPLRWVDDLKRATAA